MTAAPQPLRARIQLDVVDPTDLQGRLQLLLGRELATRGIEILATPDGSVARDWSGASVSGQRSPVARRA